MQDQTTQHGDCRNRSARFAFTQRGVAEVIGFSCALALTVASAIAVKEANHATPALLQTVPAPQVETVVDEPVIDSVAALAEDAPGVEFVEATAEEIAELGLEPTSTRWFNGRKVRPARTMWMTVTAYSPDARSCGNFADGITASNKSIWTNGMKLVAADTRMLPFGTLLSVPGYDQGRIVPVLDRGGAIKGNRLDVLYPTHEIARKWGVQKLPVTVWEYVE